MADNRGEYLGGSDAPAVLGVSKWSTPLELYRKKINARDGVIEPEADADKAQVFGRGHELEPFIVNMVVRKLRAMDLRVELVEKNRRHVDPEFSYLRAEIDFEFRLWGRVQVGDEWVNFDGETVNADAKSVNYGRGEWGEELTEDVPIYYAAQFMHGLMVTGRRYCLVGALMSFDEVKLLWIVRDEATITGMRAKLVRFWNDHVLQRVEPDPINFADVKLLFPTGGPNGTPSTPEIEQAIEELQRVRDQRRDLEKRDDDLCFQIAAHLGPKGAVFDGRGRVLATFTTDYPKDGSAPRRVLRLKSPPKKGKTR